jgi:L-asparagine transporter-like permease
MGTSITWRILLFYVASVFLIVCVVPWTDIVPGESPFTRSLVAMNFGWASTAMSVIILTAVLSCLNSAVYVSSRVLYVLAEKGDAPRWLVEVNARRVPSRSILLGAIAGVIGVVVATVSPDVVFAFLVAFFPVLVNTIIGLRSCEQSKLDLMRSYRASRWLTFRLVELPNALFVMLAGVRTAMAVNVGTAPIAFLIGGGGLGELIFTGIDLQEPAMMLAGAIPTALLAVAVDFLFGQAQYWLVPRGVNPLRNS